MDWNQLCPLAVAFLAFCSQATSHQPQTPSLASTGTSPMASTTAGRARFECAARGYSRVRLCHLGIWVLLRSVGSSTVQPHPWESDSARNAHTYARSLWGRLRAPGAMTQGRGLFSTLDAPVLRTRNRGCVVRALHRCAATVEVNLYVVSPSGKLEDWDGARGPRGLDAEAEAGYTLSIRTAPSLLCHGPPRAWGDASPLRCGRGEILGIRIGDRRHTWACIWERPQYTNADTDKTCVKYV